MDVVETSLQGVLLIKPKVYGDERGFFQETYSAERYQQAGINERFIQDNHSRSSKGVLRGLHYQLKYPQGKLVSVVRGEVFDVAVDIRLGSPTFAQCYGVILDDKHHHQLYIPPGFAHGFVVLSDRVDFVYKCTEYYHPEDEMGLLWNDANIGVEWPFSEPLLSDKDKKNPLLDELIQNNALPEFVSQ